MKTENWLFWLLIALLAAAVTAAETADPTVRCFATAIALILTIIEINVLYVWFRKTF